jgi:hypothetical protein
VRQHFLLSSVQPHDDTVQIQPNHVAIVLHTKFVAMTDYLLVLQTQNNGNYRFRIKTMNILKNINFENTRAKGQKLTGLLLNSNVTALDTVPN